MIETVGSIYQTSDYARFKRLLGNRDITESRVSRIRESIEANGWVTNPIVVNEKMEIIDGQGRWSALRELGMPIQYVVHGGATIKECIALNLKQKNWNTEDYVRSYATQGKEDYIRLVNVMDKGKLSATLASALIANKFCDGSHNSAALNNGSYTCTPDACNRVMNNIEFIHLVVEKMKMTPGQRQRLFVPALFFCYTFDTTDKKRLWEIVDNSLDLIPPYNTSQPLLDAISKVYNKNLRRNKWIAFDAMYKLSLMEG